MKKLLASNGKQSNLNEKQYKIVRNPAFKKWFGNWEVLAEAKTLSNDIKGVYKLVALNDIEQFLFEISQQANNSKSERNGAIETVGKRMVELALELFPNSKVGDKFIPVVSKVVDENDEPLIVWHGTNLPFNKFDYSQTQKNDVGFVGKGFYFTPKKSLALAYAERQYDRAILSDNEEKNKSKVIVKSFFLSIKNVKVVNEPEDIGINYYKSEIGDKLEKEKIVKISDNLKKQGYQGVIWHRDNCNGCLNGRKNWEYVAFEPNQIKLADGSNTTFDINNNDIRYEKGGLIAPNGKPSKLNPEQYKLVRTSAFKKWFGDWEKDPENSSKIIDENGEPMICFHGTENKFNVFKISEYGQLGKGIYFSNYYNEAKQYSELNNSKKAKVISVFLNIKNPKYTTNYELKNSELFSEQSNEVYERLIDLKYDGLIFEFDKISLKKDKYIYLKTGQMELNAFKSEQIKLADGSNTTFDKNNDDIRFNIGGDVSDASFNNIKKDKINYLDVLKDIWSNFNINF